MQYNGPLDCAAQRLYRTAGVKTDGFGTQYMLNWCLRKACKEKSIKSE